MKNPDLEAVLREAFQALPVVIESWRKAALRSKAARRAWLKTFGAQPEESQREGDLSASG